MISYSRRQLARYAADQIENHKSSTKLARQLAGAMTATGRAKDIELLVSDIARELEDRGLIAEAQITSAHPLPENLQRKLMAEIKKLAGVKDVTLTQSVDEELLGGFKLETANHAWDKTTAKLLRDIKETA